MKAALKFFCLPFCIFITLTGIVSFKTDTSTALVFPYKKAGLTEREAAAHLLNRFTYGARPGDIDRIVKIGLEQWFRDQIRAAYTDNELGGMLSTYHAINLSNSEVLQKFPQNSRVLAMAVKEGVIDKSIVGQADKTQYRDAVEAYMKTKGFQPQAELFRQLVNQKIIRAAFSENQLREVMTDFWFNHFNVSITKNSCAEFIPAYERDVIRPNVFGRFETMVLATAKSPAMLMYLDNFSSSVSMENARLPLMNEQVKKRVADQLSNQMPDTGVRGRVVTKVQQSRKNQGLNENYAREVMELHTLGVDGGYTQNDVTQAARILTGWTIYPMENGYGGVAKNVLDIMSPEVMKARGFVHEGDFLFAANKHDEGEKVVLGKKFPENGGYQEGVELLKFLANHPSTAKFIARKLAVRFVNDDPAKSLTDKMAVTFSKSKGDIAAMLTIMAYSPEFWSKESLRGKTKSPFELTLSAVRGLDATINQPYQLFNWMNRMGQKIYYYQAPTGFPDRGQYWINTGSLLNRMNFGLAFASQRIPGIKHDLAALTKNREPESSEAALVTYSQLIMPGRDLQKTFERLNPMLNDPELQKKVEQAASKTTSSQQEPTLANSEMPMKNQVKKTETDSNLSKSKITQVSPMLAQVVGVILGSPEFQRK